MNSELAKIFLFYLFIFLILTGCGSDNGSTAKWKIKYEVIVQDSHDWNIISGIKYSDNIDSDIWIGEPYESLWTHSFVTNQDDLHIYISAGSTGCQGSCLDFTISIIVKVYINDVLYRTITDYSRATIDDGLDNLLFQGPE